MSARPSLRAFLESERAEIEGLTAGMPPETAEPYFERIDGLIAEYDRLHAALEEIGHRCARSFVAKRRPPFPRAF